MKAVRRAGMTLKNWGPKSLKIVVLVTEIAEDLLKISFYVLWPLRRKYFSLNNAPGRARTAYLQLRRLWIVVRTTPEFEFMRFLRAAVFAADPRLRSKRSDFGKRT